MDFGLLDILLHWIRANPAWAGVAIMCVAFGESLALVGLFLPGAVLMFGVGALVGAGVLPLWPTLAWAAAGAIAGDGVSFWLGRHFHQRIRVMWPLRRHPELLARSVDFFHRHGGKSVLLGRFIGPIRPVIPVVAGMLDMPPRRFVAVNVVSGLLWAPVYVLPGMVFAASLGLAAEVATRLAMLLGTLLLLLILVLWLTRRLFNLYHRHAHRLLRYGLDWAGRHPRLGHLPAALLDPAHPEARGLTLLGLLLLLAGATLLWALQALGGSALPDLDLAVRQLLQAWHTPWADRLLLSLAAFGAATTLLPLFATVLLWLIWRRHWQAAGHWLAALLFAALFSLLRLLPPAAGTAAQPMLFAAVLYGFLAVLLGREVRERWRWLAYGSTALLLSLLGFAQLYLDTQPLSEVVIGLSLGLLWSTLLGIAWLRHPSGRPAARPLLGVALVSILAAGVWHWTYQYNTELSRRVALPAVVDLDAAQWLQQDWAALPAERGDVRHRRNQPITLQYAGGLPALQQALETRGWRQPVTLDAVSWLQWLNLAAAAAELPVLPQVHEGQHQQLLLIKPEADGRRLRVLRLWPSGRRLRPGGTPLWIGNAAWLEAQRVLGTFTVPRTLEDFVAPLDSLRGDLEAVGWTVDERRRGDGREVVLLRRR
ncbi:MAG: phosphoesterase PA-phosphatase [Gammaproteobacteria bacterium HGW-Gammaproteobacteria-1]|jgi:undecaprenyl-diphosphatase|nr:MAG: phosphoesterase PA-phosphatase [Gammaproteobacteria bacterium HGW-Gammaproteobacteria-1]